MQQEAHEIAHVSDTALMTAACRAMETERPDGLIRDPFAAQLAGSRGMGIARGLDRIDLMCFGIGVRSRFLDRLVPETIASHGIATVLSIGSGLDTRPWRLELSPHCAGSKSIFRPCSTIRIPSWSPSPPSAAGSASPPT